MCRAFQIRVWHGLSNESLLDNKTFFLLIFLLLLFACNRYEEVPPQSVVIEIPEIYVKPHEAHHFTGNVVMKDYLDTMSSIVDRFNATHDYKVDEYSITHYNSWILDSLRATDYYKKKEEGIIIDNVLEWIIFHTGDSLVFPDELENLAIVDYLDNISLDVNIPEFKLRINLLDSVIYSIPIRVGRPANRYLAMAGKVVNLKTKTGVGKIVGIENDPTYINPVDNRIYKVTRRDDENVTRLPKIPWIEPEINGVRHGQWIHPTTNINTLGKAYSNGCIGVSEGNMWLIYYYSRIGTPITIRYDLEVIDDNGNPTILKDIYPSSKFAKQNMVFFPKPRYEEVSLPLCSCF